MGKVMEFNVHPRTGCAGVDIAIQAHWHVPAARAQDFTVETPADPVLIGILAAVPAPLFIKDGLFRLVYVNDAFCALMGRPRERLIGRTDFDLVAVDQARAYRERDSKVLATGIANESEETLTNADHSQMWVSTRKSRYLAPGGALYIVGIITDGTRRKQSEVDLKAAKLAAEESSRAKSFFLANMSHELRTPLNAIIGFSEVITSELFGKVGPKYQSYAKDILESGTHLLKLINDILDLSKIDAGKFELHEESCDLTEAIRQALVFVRAPMEAAGIVLWENSADGLPPLKADARSIKQIITNLVSNALKFTPRGGRISVGATLDAGNALALTVSDTGIGMDPDEIPLALTPFQQLDSAWDRKYQGTGLGLPLTKGLLSLHGGSLEIESELGKGTAVIARFPPERTLAL
jgi:PAS domain S-box-containing protein